MFRSSVIVWGSEFQTPIRQRIVCQLSCYFVYNRIVSYEIDYATWATWKNRWRCTTIPCKTTVILRHRTHHKKYQNMQSRGRFRCLDSVKVDYGTLELLLHWRIARNTCLWRHLLTRNQYASPPEGNAIPTGHVHAIITKSCVVEGFVTQRPKTLIRFSYFFP